MSIEVYLDGVVQVMPKECFDMLVKEAEENARLQEEMWRDLTKELDF